jgi:effector-binding domain-containing protein
MNRVLSGILASGLVLIAIMAHAAEPKEKEKPKAESSAVTEPRQQTLKGFVYFYGGTRTNFQNLAAKLHALIPQVKKALLDSHAEPAGSLVLIYHGVTEDPSKEFDLEVGFPIAEKATAGGEFKVREVKDYPCMSVLYTGPLSGISGAFIKLMPAVMGTGKATDEIREMYLYFEGPESESNVVHISAGMK